MTPLEKGFILVALVKIVVVFTVVMVGVALLTLMERKLAGWMQNRLGPNRVGPSGLLQPVADGIKNFIKEETRPSSANEMLFVLAPALSFIPAVMLIAVIPLASPLRIDFDITLPLVGLTSFHDMMPVSVAELPIGFVFVLAFSSLGVYGIALAGWASNSKYSLIGGLRASAQLISYEVAMGLSLIPVLLISGNASFSAIITQQQHGLWFILPLFLSFFVFLISGFAETNRLPFDLPEAESELVAGYHSEYSAMKFSLFMIAEYAHIVVISAMVATLFFGGWDVPFIHWDEQPGVLQTLVTGAALFVKTFFWIFFVMWIRWTLPRFRYDQLMAVGWKILLPLALAYIMVIAVAVQLIERGLGWTSPRAEGGALFALNLLLGWLVFFLLDRGRVVRGVAPRARGTAAIPREGAA